MSSNLDSLLDVLQAERRRIVLELFYALQCEHDCDEVTVQVSDLARQVAATEADVDSATIGRTVQRSSNVGLRHTHLPMLDDYGIIEYDTTDDEVSTTDRTRLVAQLLHRIQEDVETVEIERIQSTTPER